MKTRLYMNEVLVAFHMGSRIKFAHDIIEEDKRLNGDLACLATLTWILFLQFLNDMERAEETHAICLKGMTLMTIAKQLFELAKEIAGAIPDFDKPKGPGKESGNGVTTQFLGSLNEKVLERWRDEVQVQTRAGSGTNYTFDFYIPSEETAVEIALSLHYSRTEFERDLFKAILAKDEGRPVRRLILIGKKESIKRQNEPGPRAIRNWVKRVCGIEVDVKELV